MNVADEKYPDSHHDLYSKTIFGFWIYLLTDFVLFGTLFAVYAVLKKSVFGGTPPHLLFHLPNQLVQTLILLVSAYTIGIGGAFAHRKELAKTVLFFGLTFCLGLVFMIMEGMELSQLIRSGNSWQESAFLSAYFTLIGTHGVHLFFALIWIILLLIFALKEGLNSISIRRLTCLRMFWQFLNIVWVFIFTIVYLMGEIQ